MSGVCASGGRLVLNLDTGQKSVQITVQKNWSVKGLYEVVAKKMQTETDNFFLTIDGQFLDISKMLSDYHLANLSLVTFAYRAHGGSRQIQPLPGHVKLTRRPCCITEDDNEEEMRAEMPCGCPLAAMAVKQHVSTDAAKGATTFSCPNCCTPWEVFVVLHVLDAVMTNVEVAAFRQKVNSNMLQKPEVDMRKCGICGSNCIRDGSKEWPGNRNRVRCPNCTQVRGAPVDFCWVCSEEWKQGCGTNWSCGSGKCNTLMTERLRTLQRCGTKKIGGVEGCPAIRACPRCGAAISHTDQCKHVRCTCGCDFCFVCLKPMNDGKWQCGEAYTVCPVAKRQTSLPSTDVCDVTNMAGRREPNQTATSNDWFARQQRFSDQYSAFANTSTTTRNYASLPARRNNDDSGCILL